MRTLAIAFAVALSCAAFAFASDDGNLIEYGRGGFGDGGIGPPMLYPPEVKIYRDGRIVFGDEKGIWTGRVDPKRLARLERDLEREPLLRESQHLKVTNGRLISMHGGVAYIRYLDGSQEKLVAVTLHPKRGPYVNLLRRIREEIPSAYQSFRPASISFHVYPGSSWREPVEWPFKDITLAGHASADSINVTDPRAIALVIDHSFGGFSWLQTNVRENGIAYELMLEKVPGWFEPEDLAWTLYSLVRN